MKREFDSKIGRASSPSARPVGIKTAWKKLKTKTSTSSKDNEQGSASNIQNQKGK